MSVLALYVDQMLHAELARLLRAEGHDVLTASEDDHSRAEDAEILSRAIDEDRVLVTLDKHFGNWLTLPLAKHAGVVRVKVSPTITEEVAPLLIPFLSRPAAGFPQPACDYIAILGTLDYDSDGLTRLPSFTPEFLSLLPHAHPSAAYRGR